MKQSPETEPKPGFLAALAAIVWHDNFSVQIGPEDGKLRVKVSVAGARPLEAVGHPALLEAELPAAIAQYAAHIDGEIADEGVTINLPGTAAKRAPQPARKSVARKKPAVKKSAPRKPAPKKPAAKKAPAAKPATTRGASKDAKLQALVEQARPLFKANPKLDREGLVAKIGRGYERLISFAKLREKCVEGGAPHAMRKSVPAEGSGAQAWPFPTGTRVPAAKAKKETAKAAKPAKTPKPEKAAPAGPWIIKLAGKKIGETIFDKKPGDTYRHSTGEFVVKTVDAEKREIHVGTLDEVLTTAPEAPAAPKKPAGPYAIKTADGKTHGATMDALKVGEKWGAAGARDRFEVTAIDHEKREYTMKDLQAQTPAPQDASPEASA